MRFPLLSLLGFVSFASGAASAASDAAPNVVLIFVDDLGYSDLGCYGHPYHRTPNIDRLAASGMRFTAAYAAAPICSASRASLLTGKAVPRVGLEFVVKHDEGLQTIDADVPLQPPPLKAMLPWDEVTFAERLTDAGYVTGYFGKWHLEPHHGRYLGWHPWFGPGGHGFAVAEEDFGSHPYAWSKQPKSARQPTADGVIPPDSMFDRVAGFISQRAAAEQPFFVMASSFFVHTPVKVRSRWLVDSYRKHLPDEAPNRDERLEYAAFVETLDHHVGGLLRAVEDSGEADDTLILLLSDNGGHPKYCSNAPLRGSKWNLYEGGIRVPMIAAWPGQIEAGSTCDVPVIGYDLLPTLVDLAGETRPEEAAVDGASLRPLLKGSAAPLDRPLVWHFPYYHPETGFPSALDAIGVDDFAVSKTRPQSALRDGRWKLLHFAETDRVELYDLEADASEQTDLSGRDPDRAAAMRATLDTLLDDMNARRAVPKTAGE